MTVARIDGPTVVAVLCEAYRRNPPPKAFFSEVTMWGCEVRECKTGAVALVWHHGQLTHDHICKRGLVCSTVTSFHVIVDSNWNLSGQRYKSIRLNFPFGSMYSICCVFLNSGEGGVCGSQILAHFESEGKESWRQFVSVTSWQMKRTEIHRKHALSSHFLANNGHKTHFCLRNARHSNVLCDCLFNPSWATLCTKLGAQYVLISVLCAFYFFSIRIQTLSCFFTLFRIIKP